MCCLDSISNGFRMFIELLLIFRLILANLLADIPQLACGARSSWGLLVVQFYLVANQYFDCGVVLT